MMRVERKIRAVLDLGRAQSGHVLCRRLNLAPLTRYSCIRAMPARWAISYANGTSDAPPDRRPGRHLVEFASFCRSARRDSQLASILLSSRAFLAAPGPVRGSLTGITEEQ